jgi:hypothetical protein
MTHVNCAIEDPVATSAPHPEPAANAGNGSALQLCSLRLLFPADPLTRLLMNADGVSQAYLDSLVRKIAKQRGQQVRMKTWMSDPRPAIASKRQNATLVSGTD